MDSERVRPHERVKTEQDQAAALGEYSEYPHRDKRVLDLVIESFHQEEPHDGKRDVIPEPEDDVHPWCRREQPVKRDDLRCRHSGVIQDRKSFRKHADERRHDDELDDGRERDRRAELPQHVAERARNQEEREQQQHGLMD